MIHAECFAAPEKTSENLHCRNGPQTESSVSWSRQDSVTAEQNYELAEPEAEPRRATQV